MDGRVESYGSCENCRAQGEKTQESQVAAGYAGWRADVRLCLPAIPGRLVVLDSVASVVGGFCCPDLSVSDRCDPGTDTEDGFLLSPSGTFEYPVQQIYEPFRDIADPFFNPFFRTGICGQSGSQPVSA